jgi:hypothetical protein
MAAIDARLAAYAEIERSLIQEFPDAPNGYEGLLNIARDSPPGQAKTIIAGLLAMETAPSEIKTQAVVMQARYALTGRLASEVAPGLPLTPGRETWLYTWSANSRESVALARMLADGKPDAVELVGILLDKEDAAPPPAGGNTGGEQPPPHPPGRLLQDDGALSAALVLTGPGLACAIGEDGRVRTVSLLNEIRAARKAVHNKGRE